jgi:hypothetical protein
MIVNLLLDKLIKMTSRRTVPPGSCAMLTVERMVSDWVSEPSKRWFGFVALKFSACIRAYEDKLSPEHFLSVNMMSIVLWTVQI